MKRFMVESRRSYEDIFDNYAGDYIVAETEEEAIEYYKEWLAENGVSKEEIDDYEYQVREY